MSAMDYSDRVTWEDLPSLECARITCGWCGVLVKPTHGFRGTHSCDPLHRPQHWLVGVCTACGRPTILMIDTLNPHIIAQQMPQHRMGDDVAHLPESIGALYDEARDCAGVNAYTAAVLMCRKVLMNASVDKGADPGRKFVEYVDWLELHCYTTANMKDWVDRIRKGGNAATHEVAAQSLEDARELLQFTGTLLQLIYELPGRAAGK